MSLRIIAPMDCAGFRNDLRMPTAKRRMGVMFSGPRPVRIRLRSSSQVPVDDVMNAFDAPMPAFGGRYAFGRGLLRCAARDPQCDLTAVRAGLFAAELALNQVVGQFEFPLT